MSAVFLLLLSTFLTVSDGIMMRGSFEWTEGTLRRLICMPNSTEQTDFSLKIILRGQDGRIASGSHSPGTIVCSNSKYSKRVTDVPDVPFELNGENAAFIDLAYTGSLWTFSNDGGECSIPANPKASGELVTVVKAEGFRECIPMSLSLGTGPYNWRIED